MQAFDGTQRRGCRIARGVHDAPEPLAREAAASLRRDIVALLLAAKDGKLTRAAAAGRQGRGGHASVMRSSCRRTDLNPIVLYVDPRVEPDRKQAVRGRRAGPAARRGAVLRLSAGRRHPDRRFAPTQKVGPLSVERRVTDVKINAPIDPALFKRPAS